MENADLHIHVQANKGAAWFILCVVGLMGAVFTFVGLADLLDRPSADAFVRVVIGGMCLFLTVRLARHFLLLRLTVSADKLVVRPFWGGTLVWRYSDVTAWATSIQRIEKKLAWSQTAKAPND